MNRALWSLGVLLIGLLGCFHPQTRFQAEGDDGDDLDLKEVRTIRDITEVGNVQPIQVTGIGLVTGLEGTGGSPTGGYRAMLEAELRKQKVPNVKQLLDSPDNALVVVTGLIPPGSRKGDPIDVEATLPHGSKATSLRGGYLHACPLKNYANSKDINPDKAERLLAGHKLASARGTLLVGFAGGEEVALGRGRVWEGGVSLLDRPYFLILNKKENKFASIANAVAERINVNFQDDPRKQSSVLRYKDLLVLGDVTQQINDKFETPQLSAIRSETAKAETKERIRIRVPYAYRHNHERYLRVVLSVPLREAPELKAAYRQKLQKMLLDPAQTVVGAHRLEALGKESVPALKTGLASEHALVRFSAAEALTYLGSTSGAEELASLAERHPPLRGYCLTALASLDENVCRNKLGELLTSADAEVRYGAFRALYLLDESDSRLNGALLNNAFWVHRVAPRSPGLVHFAARKRAEIVLFGEEPVLLPPFRILAGPEFTVTAETGDDRCTVSRISARHDQKQQCSLRLQDVLIAMADLGAQYPDAVELLRKAGDRQRLSCPVRVNALPDAVAVETLAENGRDSTFLKEEPTPRNPVSLEGSEERQLGTFTRDE